jgi:antitoxin ParD1/3/4
MPGMGRAQFMKPAGQMTLTLTPELEQFVREEVRRGAFASSSEYVRDLVRERYLKERDRAAKQRALDAALARGIADAEAGRVTPLGEAFERLRVELDLPVTSNDK